MTDPKPAKSLQTVSNIPVFNIIVHVRRDTEGNVNARVANLPDLVCSASSERDVLAKIVKEFKQFAKSHSENETPIPWIEPISPKESDEQTRFIPVHL